MKLLLRMACVATFLGAAPEAFATTGKAVGLTAVKQQLEVFFGNRLNGAHNSFDKKLPLKHSQVDEYEKMVWSAWKHAIENNTEQKLIPLGILDSTASGRWDLPN